MTPDMLMGILRALIPGLVAATSHWGIGTDAQNTALFTAIATVLVGAWSAYSNTQNSLIKTVNATDNGVTVIPTAKAVAAGIRPANSTLK